MMVSVKVCEKVPMNALTVTVPAVDPAVTMTCAWPLALVSTDCDESVAVPLVTAKPIERVENVPIRLLVLHEEGLVGTEPGPTFTRAEKLKEVSRALAQRH